MQGDQLADDLGGEALEESPQGSLIGKAREPQQGEKGSVVLQNLGLVDASQARHDGVQESQNQIAGKIVGMPLRLCSANNLALPNFRPFFMPLV